MMDYITMGWKNLESNKTLIDKALHAILDDMPSLPAG